MGSLLWMVEACGSQPTMFGWGYGIPEKWITMTTITNIFQATTRHDVECRYVDQYNSPRMVLHLHMGGFTWVNMITSPTVNVQAPENRNHYIIHRPRMFSCLMAVSSQVLLLKSYMCLVCPCWLENSSPTGTQGRSKSSDPWQFKNTSEGSLRSCCTGEGHGGISTGPADGPHGAWTLLLW